MRKDLVIKHNKTGLSSITAVGSNKQTDKSLKTLNFPENKQNIQISPGVRAVWSESLLGAFLIDKDANCLHADNGDALRKHAYSNILKISFPKTEKNQKKNRWYFFICLLKT